MSWSSLHRSAKRFLVAASGRARGRLLRVVGLPLAAVFELVMRRSGRKVGIALVYHGVGDPPGDPRRELLPLLGRALFAGQVRHLGSRYRLVHASELFEAAGARRRGERFPVAITFDDDLRSHLEVAGPLLTEARATATFFLNGASLSGAMHAFWWQRLQAAFDRGLDLSSLGLSVSESGSSIHALGRVIENLDPRGRDEVDARLAEVLGPVGLDAGLRLEDVNQLVAQGFETGFHTLRHDSLPALPDDELERALHEGRRELEDAIGEPVQTIAYPHGKADVDIAQAARSAGFDFGFTGRPEPVTPAKDPLLLGRLSPSYASVGELAFDVAWALVASSGRR
jgi:peptidoglycan/xylan/chitin deacetylase (PgdA/CDA1 family)